LVTFSWVLGTGYVGALGPLITSATVPLSIQFNCTISEFISGTNGGLIVAIGLFGIIGNAMSVVVGKRPVYTLGNILCAVSCFWCAYATNLKSLTAARVIQGFGIAPFEILVPPSISDYHFVHTRGIMMSLFNFGVLGGINLASPIAGGIIDNLGLTACFNIAGGFGIFLTIFCFLFMPETSFHRSSALAIDAGSHDNLHKAVEAEDQEKAQASEVVQVDSETGAATQTVVGKRQSFWKDLRIFVTSFAEVSNNRVIGDTTIYFSWLFDHSVSLRLPSSFGLESCSVLT
jgi:MFS family permease